MDQGVNMDRGSKMVLEKWFLENVPKSDGSTSRVESPYQQFLTVSFFKRFTPKIGLCRLSTSVGIHMYILILPVYISQVTTSPPAHPASPTARHKSTPHGPRPVRWKRAKPSERRSEPQGRL